MGSPMFSSATPPRGTGCILTGCSRRRKAPPEARAACSIAGMPPFANAVRYCRGPMCIFPAYAAWKASQAGPLQEIHCPKASLEGWRRAFFPGTLFLMAPRFATRAVLHPWHTAGGRTGAAYAKHRHPAARFALHAAFPCRDVAPCFQNFPWKNWRNNS